MCRSNFYVFAGAAYCLRSTQCAPLPMDPNFANRQILERTAKQEFITRKSKICCKVLFFGFLIIVF